MRLSGIGGLAATLLLAAGCAATAFLNLQPGRSTEGDVRRALGEPAMTLPAGEGGRQLVFPTGPLGTQTWMAFIASDGRLVRLEQALAEESLRRVSPGITSDEVLRLIGPPYRRTDFPNLGQVAWDYRTQDPWGYYVEYSVMVDSRGIVASTVSVRQDYGRGRSG